MWNQLAQLVESGEQFESPFSTKDLAWVNKVVNTYQQIGK